MKKLFTPLNIIYAILMTIIANSFVLVKLSAFSLILIVPIFIIINMLAGFFTLNTKKTRLKICKHGGVLLSIFVFTLIPSLAFHIYLAFNTIPDNYMILVYSILYCVLFSAILFWNGIICVYLTSAQMGLKWRVIGALCGFVPILNLIVLSKIILIVMDEVEFEIDKELILDNSQEKDRCETKYPILLVHGVFFRDSNFFNYWGRIPRELEARGAKVFYGNHQSALSIEESARELASRIKLIIEKTGCEKVNIIAHSKGGLDCRYALSEFGMEDYVASLTTVNTPHRGCIFADNLLNLAPEKLKKIVSKAYNTTLKQLGDENPDFMAAVNDLTASSWEKLNEKLKDPTLVYTQSIGSIMTYPRSGKFPLNLSYRYVKKYDGENDGLVGETSFKWGNRYILLRTKGKRGISHGDVIDLNRENLKDFDVRTFYVSIVNDLKKRGY